MADVPASPSIAVPRSTSLRALVVSAAIPVVLAAGVVVSVLTDISIVFGAGALGAILLTRLASTFPAPEPEGPRRTLSQLMSASRAYLELHGANVGLRPGLATLVVRVLWAPIVVGIALLWVYAIVDLVRHAGDDW